MASIGPLYPGSAPVNDPTSTAGVVSWTNPDRAQTQNDSGATVTISRTNASLYLIALNYGPSLPAGATLSGILVELRLKLVSGSNPSNLTVTARFCTLVFSKGKWVLTFFNDTKGTLPSTLTGSFAYYALGSSSDIWGFDPSVNVSFFNDSTVGLSIQASTAHLTDTPQVELDTARITYYTPAPAGSINLLLMGVGSILSAASAWLGYLPWLRSKLWHAGYWLKGGRWATRQLQAV